MPPPEPVHDHSNPSDAARVVVMGVSGCGKTTLAEALGATLDWHVLDADDLHPATNVAKMREGTPLTDADRQPWLQAVGDALIAPLTGTSGRVVACSALKRAYRDQLRGLVPGVEFLFLHGTFDTIMARLSQRKGHYMPSSLLETQFQTLEVPTADEGDVVPISLALSIEQMVALLRPRWAT
jgi:carbohydrate kinase (thermoresistant glucokinase family)